MRTTRSSPMMLLGWLLVGRLWSGVDAWEELAVRRKPFRTEAACQHHLARQRAKASPGATRWEGARCVTKQEFQRYPKCETGNFDFGAVEPDEATRKRLRALGYLDSN